MQARLDGFKNLFTAFGTDRDHGYQFNWSQEARLAKGDLDDLPRNRMLMTLCANGSTFSP